MRGHALVTTGALNPLPTLATATGRRPPSPHVTYLAGFRSVRVRRSVPVKIQSPVQRRASVPERQEGLVRRQHHRTGVQQG